VELPYYCARNQRFNCYTTVLGTRGGTALLLCWELVVELLYYCARYQRWNCPTTVLGTRGGTAILLC